MTNQKFLPKKAYSINDAVKYISLNHNINITELDLIEYIQNGDLIASVHLDGSIRKIDYINRKEFHRNEALSIRNEEIFIQFSKSECNAKIKINEDFEVIRVTLNNVYFDLDIILNKEFYLESYFSDNDLIKLYSGEIGRFQNILFNGYFPLSKELFDRDNVRTIIERGYLQEFEDIFINKGEGFYFHLPIYENRTKIYLEDIYILHQDIIEFLELFSVIKPDNQQEEIYKIKEQLRNRNDELSRLYQEIEVIKNKPSDKEIKGKSETSYLNIIQALKDELLADEKFKNQSELITFLADKYQGYTGLTESNLRDKFAKANQIK
ncbi:Uncharacterised protein [Actinobacillus lignieresii]|uniref:SlyX protein n=1 Tax=Actinobacillus lignieresii TaxID=720 RepID=UPI000F6C4CA9|nr:SlyX protein [Actinobacillus lignieresii]VEB25938.1 Uncharacterised protein [Actinobacillus lignieresii]